MVEIKDMNVGDDVMVNMRNHTEYLETGYVISIAPDLKSMQVILHHSSSRINLFDCYCDAI